MNGTTHRLLQVPPGVQCFVGDEARRRRWIEERVLAVFEGWDYGEIIPPLFDYADVFAGQALAAKTYSFVARDGSVLALRPDFTALLAKIAAARLADQPLPIRLYYSGEVLRYEPPKAGRQSELYQVGLEHLGGNSAAADVEALAIAAECLEALGVRGWTLTLGHVGIFSGLLDGTSLEPAALEALRERMDAKDGVGVRDVLERARVGGEITDTLVRLTALAGEPSVLEEATRLCAHAAAARAAVLELRETVDALRTAGLGEHVVLDLGEVRALDYYTGLVFRVYAPGLGFDVGGGGRYDTLLARFGRALPAVGFMLGLDRVALLLERQGAAGASTAAAVETIQAAAPLGESLTRARARRADGVRIRFQGEKR